jgi:aminopeptidase N
LLVILLSAVTIAPKLSAQPDSDPALRPFDVIHYTARIEPDVSGATVKGVVAIRLVVTAANQNTIDFDSGDLTVDAVREGQSPLDFETRDRHLLVRWPRPARLNETREIDVVYHGAPRSGILFPAERSQVYTVFSTSQWMVCVNAPDDKATMDLTVVLPGDLTMVASGRPVATRVLASGAVEHEWRQDRPMPSYTFGFAAGRFTDLTEDAGVRRLRFLGSGFSAAQLRQIFADSADMMRFFEDRAGVPFGNGTYTQALVATTVGQELDGFSLMSEAYGRAVLDDPHAESLAAHELAHQWWGNSVTCAAWTHMWLNEGFATFMAAAYVEQRFGRDPYQRIVEGWRSSYEKIREAGHDRSLVFPDWDRPSPDDRTLVYQKGAYVLHLLREMVGDRVFWAAVRDYTRMHAGLSVTTSDFQRAMERSTGRDLSAFFRTWVY